MKLGPRGRMLTPSMELEGARPSLKDPIHSNGPAIVAKMAGANKVEDLWEYLQILWNDYYDHLGISGNRRLRCLNI